MISRRLRSSLAVGAAASCVFGLNTEGYAQTPEPEAQQTSGQLAEVTVTARRQEELLRRLQ